MNPTTDPRSQDLRDEIRRAMNWPAEIPTTLSLVLDSAATSIAFLWSLEGLPIANLSDPAIRHLESVREFVRGLPSIRIPNGCDRRCDGCAITGHHWLEHCPDPSDPDEDELPLDHPAIRLFDIPAFFVCQHCPEWITMERHDQLAEDAGEGDGDE